MAKNSTKEKRTDADACEASGSRQGNPKRARYSRAQPEMAAPQSDGPAPGPSCSSAEAGVVPPDQQPAADETQNDKAQSPAPLAPSDPQNGFNNINAAQLENDTDEMFIERLAAELRGIRCPHLRNRVKFGIIRILMEFTVRNNANKRSSG